MRRKMVDIMKALKLADELSIRDFFCSEYEMQNYFEKLDIISTTLEQAREELKYLKD